MKKHIIIFSILLIGLSYAGWEVVEDQTNLLSPDGTETLSIYRDIDNDSVYLDWTFGDLVMQGGSVIFSGGLSTASEIISVTGGIKVPAGPQLFSNADFTAWSGAANPNNNPTDWTAIGGRTANRFVEDANPGMRIFSGSPTGVGVHQTVLLEGKEYLVILEVATFIIHNVQIRNGITEIFTDFFIDGNSSAIFVATDEPLSIESGGLCDLTVASFEVYELTDGPSDEYTLNGSFNGKTKYTSVNTHADGAGGADQEWDLWWDGSTDWVISLTAGTKGVNYWNRSNTSQLGLFNPNGNVTGSINTLVPSIITADGVIVTSLDVSTGVYTNAAKQLTSSIPSTGTLGFWTRTTGPDILTPSNVGDNLVLTGDLDMSDGFIENAGYIQFDLDFNDGFAEGRLQWNAEDGVPEVGLPGGKVNMQIGNEMPFRVTNDEGAEIPNGRAVLVNGATGNRLTVRLPDLASQTDTFAVVALATEDLANPGTGYVNTIGFVRGDTDQPIDTSGFAEGGQVFLGDQGVFLDAPPVAPNRTVFIGIVKKVSATEGEIWVNIIHLPMLHELSDVLITSITDAQIIAWDAGDSRWENKTPTSHTQVAFSMYDAEPARSSETSLDGAFILLTAGTIASPTPTQLGPATPANDVSISKGTGKIVVVVVAGSDFDGEITVTGTSVDRDTGATTGADTDTITVDAITTDTSDTDTNGNARHAFTGAYITSKWFVGTVVLSTTTLNCTIYAYHVSFEQFDDTADITLDTFDANILTTSVNAEFDAYLYSIEVTGDKCDITREASLNVGSGGETALANRYWRLRRGNINKAIDGTTDGTWVDVHYSNSPAFVEDVSIKVWATEIVPLTLN